MNPRLLLLEDDPVSAAFLRQVLAVVPAQVEHAASVAAGRRLACAQQQLWIFDARLPDGHGAALLAQLRAQGLDTPALALTADDDPRTLARLVEAGFVQAMSKPIDAATLLVAVRRHLRQADVALPWDDPAALRALGGSASAMAALRRLFLDELPAQARAVGEALDRGEQATARDHLHRLRASCGFVGAPALLAAAQRLSAEPESTQARLGFESRARELLAG